MVLRYNTRKEIKILHRGAFMDKDSFKRFLGDGLLRAWWRLRKRFERAHKGLRRAALRNRRFTVLSNNCFGGFVYQRYRLPYLTPTVGLFFMPEDYLRLLSDPKRYLALPLCFIEPRKARYAQALARQDPSYGRYPVARLDDVEVYFMHYASEQEAREKWQRRCARIEWDNLLVKFCDQNGATPDQLRAFDALPYPNKVCFTARPYPQVRCAVFLRRDAGQPCVRAETEELHFARDYPLTRVLNRMRKKAPG